MATITPHCVICFESFKTPKVLTCGHTFCLCCLERYIGANTKKFRCPICKQRAKVPEGGAKMFTTNFIVQTSKHTTQVRGQPPSTTLLKCPNHKQKEVDYYCNNCNVGLCFRCISITPHKEHETLDIECDKTRNEALEKLQRSKQIIQNRIKNMEKSRSTLLESYEQMKSLCKDSCSKVAAKTEQIVSELRKSCETIIKDIRKNLDENRSKVEDREMEITCDINLLESNMESNISPSTKTTLNILLTLPGLIEIEKLGESRKDDDLCVQYLQWVGKDFNLDIDQLGSIISKPFYIPGLYQFLFNVSELKADRTHCDSKNKFKNNNLVWSCYVIRHNDDLHIGVKLLPDDNPRLNYCTIDYQISVLNIDDDSQTKTETYSKTIIKRGEGWSLWHPITITWSKVTDKNNDHLNSNGQFVVQFDIKQIREIEFIQ